MDIILFTIIAVLSIIKFGYFFRHDLYEGGASLEIYANDPIVPKPD